MEEIFEILKEVLETNCNQNTINFIKTRETNERQLLFKHSSK
jgi:hypothetical protein